VTVSDLSAYKNVWCVAEQRLGKISPSIYELISAGKKVAEELGQQVCVVLVGKGVSSEAQNLAQTGVDKIFVLENDALENFVGEVHGKILANFIEKEKPNKVFLAATSIGRSWAARTAVLVKTGLAAEVTELSVDKTSGHLNMRRPCCSGTLMVTTSCKKARPEMATIRAGSFSAAEKANGKKGEVVKVPVDLSGIKSRTSFKAHEPQTDDVIDVTQADMVVSGGYGLGSPEGFKPIKELAKLMGAAVGASRRVVDLGWIPYRHQVGLTGRTIKPKLYMACGISGQIQHLAGMSQSDTIVAINKDPEAPLMKIADFAVEGDLHQIIPSLIEELKKSK